MSENQSVDPAELLFEYATMLSTSSHFLCVIGVYCVLRVPKTAVPRDLHVVARVRLWQKANDECLRDLS